MNAIEAAGPPPLLGRERALPLSLSLFVGRLQTKISFLCPSLSTKKKLSPAAAAAAALRRSSAAPAAAAALPRAGSRLSSVRVSAGVATEVSCCFFSLFSFLSLSLFLFSLSTRPRQKNVSTIKKKKKKKKKNIPSSQYKIVSKPTKPIEGQKTGTSGLRKKTKVFSAENYLANWVQSLFRSLGAEKTRGQTLGLGGDGRYFNKEAAQIILKSAAAAGFSRVVVGKGAIMATPAMSALIRRRALFGGLIMSASHNPGGPDEDWGIKFNASGGEPAPESVTDAIFAQTTSIGELRFADIPDVDLSKVGETVFDLVGVEDGKQTKFTVEVVDPVADYLKTLQEVFDFGAIRALIARPDFSMVFDAMHAVTG